MYRQIAIRYHYVCSLTRQYILCKGNYLNPQYSQHGIHSSRYRCIDMYSSHAFKDKQGVTPGSNRNSALIGLAAVLVCGGCAVSMRYFMKIKSSPTQEEYVMPNTKNLKLCKRNGHWIPYDFIGSDKQLSAVRSFEVRDSDVFVVSFPKSGTTWVQEIVFRILNFGSTTALMRNIDDRFPYLEFAYPGINQLKKMSKQRLIKTHLQFDALPIAIEEGKGKVIYVARNVKDVTVSMFHFYQFISNVSYCGSFEEFCEIFNSGKVAYGPYWKHVGEYWVKRQQPNILYITYEDLQKDPVMEIIKIATFLEKPLKKEQAEFIAENCSFKKMRNNPFTNYDWHKLYGIFKFGGHFMRKGEVGDWENYYTPELLEKTNRITEEQFKPIGLKQEDKV